MNGNTEAADEATFTNQLKEVRVGECYEEVEIDDRTIRKGDVVLMDDRDMDERDFDRGVHSRTFVGFVESILKPDRGGEPEIFATAECGRIPVSDAEVAGEGSLVSKSSGLSKFVDQFLSNYDEYMTLEWGENINDSGEDFQRTGE